MSDVHDRFDAWLDAAGQPDLARDVAMHASGCDRCLRQAIAIDGLLAIDVGDAPPPPMLDPSAIGVITTAPRSQLRFGAWVVAVSVVAAAGVTGIFNLPAFLAGPTTANDPAAPTAEGILGGGPATPTITPQGSASSAPSASGASASSSPSDEPIGGPSPTVTERPEITTVTPRTAPPTIDPTREPTSRPTTTPDPTTRPPTPRPTITPRPTPDPTPSPDPTPVPTPTPPPTPTPSPTPQCSDGIDNDGDGRIDFGLDPEVNDPGCLSPIDDDETDPLP